MQPAIQMLVIAAESTATDQTDRIMHRWTTTIHKDDLIDSMSAPLFVNHITFLLCESVWFGCDQSGSSENAIFSYCCLFVGHL